MNSIKTTNPIIANINVSTQLIASMIFNLGVKKNSGKSGVYTVVAEARMPNGAKGRLKSVIRKAVGKDGLPFTILDWKQVHMDDESFFSENMDQYLIN